ncbi:MAG: hypothetical protein V7634_1579 [Bradyrhizobium sp.]|jgi:hypothetical protein
MKITLAQHGGQAAGLFMQRPPAIVDAATLDRAQAAQLKSLVAAAIASPSAGAASGKTRDEMNYTITVEQDGQGTVLNQSDTTMSAQFRELLGWVKQHRQQ